MITIKTEFGLVTLKLDTKNKVEIHLPQGVSGRILAIIKEMPEYKTAVAELRATVVA